MPVSKCPNGKWRIGSGDCIYDTKEKAIEVWQAIIASGHYVKIKISYDFDGALSISEWVEKAKEQVKDGTDVYVISARYSKEAMVYLAAKIGIPTSHIIATGSNKQKIDAIRDMGISMHYDNNPSVIEAIKKFTKGILVNG